MTAKAKLRQQEIARVMRAVATLNTVLAEVRERMPEANYYLEDSGNFHLLSGPSHDGMFADHARPDRSLLRLDLLHSGGGGW